MLAAQHSLLTLFDAYLTKARSPQREAYLWSDSMDQILVSWPNRDETTMHILVAHALTILLAHGPGLGNAHGNRGLTLELSSLLMSVASEAFNFTYLPPKYLPPPF
jgi:hypothetical protein